MSGTVSPHMITSRLGPAGGPWSPPLPPPRRGGEDGSGGWNSGGGVGEGAIPAPPPPPPPPSSSARSSAAATKFSAPLSSSSSVMALLPQGRPLLVQNPRDKQKGRNTRQYISVNKRPRGVRRSGFSVALWVCHAGRTRTPERDRRGVRRWSFDGDLYHSLKSSVEFFFGG